MLKDLFMWILQNIFKVPTESTQKELRNNESYANEYERIDEINFNAIFGNKLANYIANDSNMEILGDNKRAELLNTTGKNLWKKIKKIASMQLGYGGIIIVPYVKNGKILYNLIPQSRLTIDETEGDKIVGATLLAEKKVIKGTLTEKVYLRWTNYQIKNGNLTILQQYTDKEGNKIPTPDFWKDIQELLMISNVDRVPFGYVKSPVNNRTTNDKYGVPITYGADSTIKEIRECLKQISDEFRAKEVFIAIDRTALDKDGKIPNSHVFSPIDAGKDDFWNIFDPAIRDSSYYARLQELYSRLEIELGTSEGILTKPTSSYQNVDETRRAMFDTSSLIDNSRTNIEAGLEDFFYACDILANAFNLGVSGEYNISYDWSYGYIESTETEYRQLKDGVSIGIVKKAELRNWIKPSETIEESQEIVEEIEKENPTIEDLIGSNKE